MIQDHQQRLNVLRLVRIERRIEIGPSKELVLIANKKVGLRTFASQLQARVKALEIMVAERNGTIGGRMSPGDIRPDPFSTSGEFARESLVEFRLGRAKFTPTRRGHSTCLDGSPCV